MSLDEKSKKLLTRASDRISMLYVEKAIIEQSEYGVQIRQDKKISEVPITTITCLILGPGTSITHRAVANIAAAGCSICWMGSEQAVFYAYGIPTTNKSKNILKQIKYHESKMLHIEVVRKMYSWRYPSDKIKTKSLEELKGLEGMKMRDCYARYAQEYGIEWEGRRYEAGAFEKSSLTNQYLTALNHVLYAITEAIILIMGYSPAVGFIHTGHISSFVFDISDLFKESVTVPLAFRLSSEYDYFDRHIMLTEYRKELVAQRIIPRMAEYLGSLFDDDIITIDAELKIWNVNTI